MCLRREGGVTARCIAILPPTQNPNPRSVSVEGFEPSTPCARGTCAAKLRYTLRTLHAPGGNRTHRFPVEGRASCHWTTGADTTHGWIRTTTSAVNSRALYRLSYMGMTFLSRVDSNHDLRIQRPALLPVELRLSSKSNSFREKDSNLQHLGSEPSVLPG